MGSIEQLDSGRWRGIPRDPETGAKMNLAACSAALGTPVTTFTFETERAAEVFVSKVEQAATRQARLQVVPVIRRVRFSEHYEDLESRNVWAKRTVTWYRVGAKAVAADLGDPYLDELVADPTILERYRASLAKNPDISGRTVNARITVITRVCRDAYRLHLITADPSHDIDKVTVAEEPHRIIEEDELAQLLPFVPQRLQALVLLGYDAGLRREELAGLHMHRLDLRRREVLVIDVVDEDGSIRGFTKGARGLAARNRTVPLTERTALALNALLRARKTGPRDPVFLNEDGNAIRDLRSLTRSFGRWVRAAGLAEPYPTLHDLRHSYGTKLARGGTPLKVIATLMGHADLQVTQKYIDAAGPSETSGWVRHALEGGPNPLANGLHVVPPPDDDEEGGALSFVPRR